MSNPTNIGQKLPFRIVDFSGEDPQYPVTELLTSSPQSKGWQSERFCDWPQFLILQFFSPIRLKQLQFLSHQAKISSKIEIFAALPANKSQSLVDLEYKKLGYLILDPNEKSGYQSRELKTVYLDNVCMYLKIVLNKCFMNKFNVFNQVGIIALGIFGDPTSGMVPTKRIETPTMEQERVIDESQFDAITIAKLKELDYAKTRSVELEDFDEAKKIKVAVERLRHIGAQLKHLEESKKRAIQVEDYDSAKIINQEIVRLRDTVAPATVGIKYMKEKPQIKVQFVQDEPPLFDPRARQDDMRPQDGYEEEKQEPPASKKKMTSKDIVPITTTNTNNTNHDDQVIPAMMNKKANAFMDEERPEKGASSSRQDEGETLSAQAQKFADPLIPIIGDELAKKIFSKSWNSREEGLKLLENDLTGKPQYINKKSPGAVFVAAMGAVSYTINDKVNQVSLNAMNVLQALMSQDPPQISSKNELLSYVDNIVNGLLEKIGDNNARVREQAENSLVGMAYHPLVTCNLCVSALLKASSTKNKMTVSTKHIIGRLMVLSQIVRDFQIDNKDVPYQPVVAYAVEKVENSSVDIRNAATNLLIEIYSVVGDRLMSDLESVRNNQLEILVKEFDAVAVRMGAGGKRKGGAGGHGEQKKAIVTTNIAPQGAKKGVLKKGGAGRGNAGTAPKSGENHAPGPICEFCEKKDRNFSDARKMDFHLWRECPMLLTCEGCGQIVEISQLNTHLLEECETRKFMRRCPRCKEPVHVEDYKQHTEEMSCLQSQQPTRANRCPLCHMDIPPGEMGWKQHLLVQGCPNNERTA